MRALRLAPALLLALAACVVNTDDLKPKSDAECAAPGGTTPTQKACGYKCVALNDPALGCGNPGCQPCPSGGPGWDVYCDPTGACATRPPCPVDQAYCDGPFDTICDDLATNPSHCGACGHSCGAGSCNGFECSTWQLSPPGLPNPPVDVASFGASYLWVRNNTPSPGWTLFRDGLNYVPGPGTMSRVYADGYGAIVYSDVSIQPLVEVNNGTVTTLYNPTSPVLGVSADPSYAYFVQAGSTVLGESATDLLEVYRTWAADPTSRWSYPFPPAVGALTSVAIEDRSATGSNVVVGTTSRDLRWVDYLLTQTGTYATGIEPPVELVVFDGFVGTGASAPKKKIAFWVGASGNVYSRELPVGPVLNLTQWPLPSLGTVDLFADAEGVYWVDSGVDGGSKGVAGVVAEWRARFDDLVLLYASPIGRPFRVTATDSTHSAIPSHVVWLDAQTGEVLAVPK